MGIEGTITFTGMEKILGATEVDKIECETTKLNAEERGLNKARSTKRGQRGENCLVHTRSCRRNLAWAAFRQLYSTGNECYSQC